MLQQAQAREITRARPNFQILARHRFEIVIEHVGLRRDHDLKRTRLAQEIRRKNFNRRARRLRADRADGAREVFCAAVGEIVAIDRRDDDVLKPQLRDRIADLRRFVAVERAR